MSKPQIDTIKADVFRQLTSQDVAERLRRSECAVRPTLAKIPRPAAKPVLPSKSVDLADVPEHLF